MEAPPLILAWFWKSQTYIIVPKKRVGRMGKANCQLCALLLKHLRLRRYLLLNSSTSGKKLVKPISEPLEPSNWIISKRSGYEGAARRSMVYALPLSVLNYRQATSAIVNVSLIDDSGFTWYTPWSGMTLDYIT